eukprot:9764351-Lingulodinium_polyedra.AAC.1
MGPRVASTSSSLIPVACSMTSVMAFHWPTHDAWIFRIRKRYLRLWRRAQIGVFFEANMRNNPRIQTQRVRNTGGKGTCVATIRAT